MLYFMHCAKAGLDVELSEFEYILNRAVLCLFKQARNPDHILNSIIPLPNTASYNMRSQRLPLPLCRTSRLKDHFIFKAVSLYNSE